MTYHHIEQYAGWLLTLCLATCWRERCVSTKSPTQARLWAEILVSCPTCTAKRHEFRDGVLSWQAAKRKPLVPSDIWRPSCTWCDTKSARGFPGQEPPYMGRSKISRCNGRRHGLT